MHDAMNSFIDALANGQLNEVEPRGMAFTMRVVPDLFTGEIINIGVTVISPDGVRLVRVLETTNRLKCFYGDEGARHILSLAEVARASALAGAPSPSPNVQFDAPTPFFHISAEQALASLFDDQVSAARLAPSEESEAAATLGSDKLRAQIYNFLKLKAPSSADSIIPQSPMTMIQTRRGPRGIRVPLQPIGAVGGLESADYAAATVKLHLMNAALDLECAAETLGRPKLGFFVARPIGQRAEIEESRIDSAIDYVVARLPARCQVEIESNVETLADRIIAWAA